MNILNVSQFGTDISSRASGRSIRSDLVAKIRRDGVATVDFSGVQTVSHSFADEFLAIIVANLGEEWFRDHVVVRGLSPTVRSAVLNAIESRLNSHKRSDEADNLAQLSCC